MLHILKYGGVWAASNPFCSALYRKSSYAYSQHFSLGVCLASGKCVIFFFLLLLFLKEQNSRHFEEHREAEDMSEKMSPNKNLKSPQKGSKRLKTSPFKVTLLDAAAFEGEVEVRMMQKQTAKFTDFNSFWSFVVVVFCVQFCVLYSLVENS